ncbi:MAG: aspartate/tyrosine/aromatic aminotransferase [Gammaproteobacteria bacterium]|jgi:aspartate aminotransferase
MFESFEKLPDDPILGLTVAYNKDPNPHKIDLGAGVYKTEDGNTPIFDAVKKAEAIRLETETTKTYTPISGDPAFCERIRPLILGADHAVIKEGRACAAATPGGSGSLRLAGELINSWKPGADLWVCRPTWGNHIPLLGQAGLNIREYPYYDPDGHGILFEEMLKTLSGLGPDDVVLLHGCCHNPTGADLSPEQWRGVAGVAAERGFLPLVDFAYQGLGESLEQDAYGVRLLAESVPEMLIAYSCSKNFGLYRDRIGALAAVTPNPDAAGAVLSHMKVNARRLYSVPPAHGAIVVATILADPGLRQNWEQELDGMCRRINDLRALFADTMKKKGSPRDFGFIKSQKGMFSFLGLDKDQVRRLREEYSIYVVANSRINVAGISPMNVDYLTDSILAVL